MRQWKILWVLKKKCLPRILLIVKILKLKINKLKTIIKMTWKIFSKIFLREFHLNKKLIILTNKNQSDKTYYSIVKVVIRFLKINSLKIINFIIFLISSKLFRLNQNYLENSYKRMIKINRYTKNLLKKWNNLTFITKTKNKI